MIEPNRHRSHRTTNGAAPLRAALLVLSFSLLAAVPGFAQDDLVDREPFPVAVAEPARLVKRVPVVYPDAARREGIAGIVVVNARVGRDGRVRETRVLNSIPELDEHAESVVRRYLFSPAIADGREVETWVQVPLRFDESLPTGTRGGDPVDARPYGDFDRSFESEVEVLRQGEAVAPNAATVEQHERVMRAALALEMIPPPGGEAIQTFLRGDSVAQSKTPAVQATRKTEWVRAALLAPWWLMPYRRLLSVAIAENDFGTAEACTRVILVARPNDVEALALVKRVRQLKLAAAVGSRKGKKK